MNETTFKALRFEWDGPQLVLVVEQNINKHSPAEKRINVPVGSPITFGVNEGYHQAVAVKVSDDGEYLDPITGLVFFPADIPNQIGGFADTTYGEKQ